MKVHIERFCTTSGMDGYTEIVAIIVMMSTDDYYRPSLSELKAAIRMIGSYKSDELFMHRPYSNHDCTGQYFTSDIELIDKEFSDGSLAYTYKHKVGRDV